MYIFISEHRSRVWTFDTLNWDCSDCATLFGRGDFGRRTSHSRVGADVTVTIWYFHLRYRFPQHVSLLPFLLEEGKLCVESFNVKLGLFHIDQQLRKIN